ncbi:hypothetical protein V3G39_10450 [Dermatophilaceae bacterium Sec6.4]
MDTTNTAPRIGWVSDPRGSGKIGMAHATYRGQSTALCGIATPYLGDSWPLPGKVWDRPYSRCSSCAHHLYAGRVL